MNSCPFASLQTGAVTGILHLQVEMGAYLCFLHFSSFSDKICYKRCAQKFVDHEVHESHTLFRGIN